MNKLLVTLAGVAGLTLSLNASAGVFQVGTTGATTSVTETSDCTLLTEAVKINTSKSVVGAYTCNATSNVIAVAMCHPNGKKTPTTNLNNIYVGDSAGGAVAAGTPTYTCTGANAQTVATTAATGS